jgi:hypothetical protein
VKNGIFARLILVISCILAAPASQAAIFNLSLSADIFASDFVINNADGAVHGVTPTDTSFSAVLRVDTGAGVDSAAAGDPTVVAGTNFMFGHDVWGYSATVLSASFGTKTWTDADIVLLNFGDGIDDSQLFLDAELGSGTPTLASFRLQNDGFSFFGSRGCGLTCVIAQGLQIRDFNGGGLDNSLNDYVFADNYDISVSAVPIPAAIWLFGTALVGFIGMSRSKKVS